MTEATPAKESGKARPAHITAEMAKLVDAYMEEHGVNQREALTELVRRGAEARPDASAEEMQHMHVAALAKAHIKAVQTTAAFADSVLDRGPSFGTRELLALTVASLRTSADELEKL